MIGLPCETPEMIEDTIKINKIVSPDSFQLSIFYPYPQTDLWDLCKKKGFLTDEYKTSFLGDSTLQLPTLSKKQIRMYYKHFQEELLGQKLEHTLETRHPAIMPFYTSFKIIFGQKATSKLFYKLKMLRDKVHNFA
jgi:radical SAM superfamily enzyme YgiQ (UPF0313 family)